MIQKLRVFILILLIRRLIYQRIMVKRIFFYRLNMKQIPTDCLLDYFCHILGVAHFFPIPDYNTGSGNRIRCFHILRYGKIGNQYVGAA